MAALYYQPVGLPSLGSAASTSANAAGTISTGLNNLGTKLTNLGTRQQQRMDKEQQEKDARGLEMLKTALGNAKDENEFNAIARQFGMAPGGDIDTAVAIPGQADEVQKYRQFLFGDQTARANVRTKEAEAGIKETNLLDTQMDLDTKSNLNNALKTYSPQVTEGFIRLNDGDIEGGWDIINKALSDMSISNPGVDSATFLKTAREQMTGGDTARTTLGKNAASRAADERSRRTSVYGIGDDARKRAQDDELRKASDELTARTINNETVYMLNDWIENSDYSPATKSAILSTINKPATQDDPGYAAIQDLLAPIQDIPTNDELMGVPIVDPLQNVMNNVSNWALGTKKPVNSPGIPISNSLDSITGMAQDAYDMSPDFKIFDRSQFIASDERFKNSVGDFGDRVNEYLGTNFKTGEIQDIKAMMSSVKVTEPEMMALIESSINQESWPWVKDNLKEDEFRRRAIAYKEGKGQMQAEMGVLSRTLVQARQTGNEVLTLKKDLARLLNGPNPNQKEIERIRGRISYLESELLSTSNNLQNKTKFLATSPDPGKKPMGFVERNRNKALNYYLGAFADLPTE